jgi:integrase
MSRRGHGEGSIYQRASDGKWVGSVNLGYRLDGKRDRKIIYGKTRKEVAERLKTLLRDQQRGLPLVTNERETLGQFLAHWLSEVARPNLRATTYATYENHIRNHITPALGRIPLQRLAPQQIQTFLNAKIASNLSPRTVADIHAVLRTALGQAMKWNLVHRNVAALVDKPRIPQKEVRFLTPDEAKKLLNAIHGDRFEALYVTTLSLGLRRGEVLGLRWQDVDIEKGILRVRQAVQRIQGQKGLQITEVKTRSGLRSINLPSVTVSALRAHRVRQIEERLLAGDRWQDTGLVFTTRLGTPIEPRNLKRSFDRVIEKAGLDHTCLHGLRHTAASFLLAQGVPMRMISDVLGHARTSITSDIYSHLYEPMRAEAAAKMDTMLGVG